MLQLSPVFVTFTINDNSLRMGSARLARPSTSNAELERATVLQNS
jgi:hypothetical protein